MRYLITLCILVLLCFSVSAEEVQWGVVYWRQMKVPIPAAQWTPETKVWLGRSCVGESGFEAHWECVAIAWVYATRYRDTGRRGSFENVIRKYSAAVKEKSTHRRPWILSLNLDGDRPERWPDKLSWKAHRPRWLQLLGHLDEWAKGNRPNPVNGANHYGGPMDKPRGAWVQISPAKGMKFGNTFYRSPF